MDKKIYGYMRVSSRDQNEHRQLVDLIDFGIERKNIYMDKLSGKDFNRPAYQKLIYKKLKTGDLLVVKSIDRLGRNYNEIIDEWKSITKIIGADIKILDMPLLDTSQNKDLVGTLISDMVLQLLSFVAENERTNIRQRQAEGIAAAKKRGIKFGRPHAEYPDNFPDIYQRWRDKRISAQEAIALCDLPSYTFYKRAKRYRNEVLNG